MPNYVITLEGYRPIPRYDEISWTEARIEEAESAAGPWTAIETIALVPDPDPSRPAARDLTTEQATLPAGWYRVTFIDGTGDEALPTEPVFAGAAITYRPSRNEVGALIRVRTKDTNGNELGTFNNDTRPTGTEADHIISEATRHVAQKVGITVPDKAVDMARDLAALRAAMVIERTYWPEQMRTDRSMYDALRDDYNENLKSTAEAVRQEASGGDMGSVDEPRLAHHNFPEDKGGIVGWNTRF